MRSGVFFKLLGIFLAGLIGASWVFAQSQSNQAAPAEPEPIKIGALMILTGEFASQGAAFREGVQLAVETVNSAGGVKGRRLEVVLEDTRSDPKLANSAARKLIDIDKVIAAITTSYPETEVGGAQFQNAGIPTIALWDSSPQIDAMGEYIFALGPWTPSAAQVAAQFSIERFGGRQLVVVNTVENWSELVADYFGKEVERLGGKVIERFRINPGDPDFRTIIAKIKALEPDAIYAPLTTDIIPFHMQLRAVKLDRPVISSDIITPELVAQSPGAFEGVYQTGIRDPDRLETRELAQKYQSKFGRSMSMPWFVATGYDAVNLYAQAIEQVGPDSKRIKDYLYTVKNYPGASQTISISPGGSSPYYESMFRIRAGKFESAM